MKKKIVFLFIVCLTMVVCSAAVSATEKCDEIFVDNPLTTEKSDAPINNNEAAANYILRAFGLQGDPVRTRSIPLTGSNAVILNAARYRYHHWSVKRVTLRKIYIYLFLPAMAVLLRRLKMLFMLQSKLRLRSISN